MGQSLAQAAALAVPEDDPALSLAAFDTGGGAGGAAAAALEEGAEILLGPLFGSDVAAVLAASGGRAPVVTFSNDADLVGSGAFVLGVTQVQSVGAILQYARRQGVRRVAVVTSPSPLGRQAARAAERLAPLAEIELTAALTRSPRGESGDLLGADRPDAVLLPEGGEALAAFAPPLAAQGFQLLGTDQWLSADLGRLGALEGAWHSAPAPAAFAGFASAYQQRHGETPGLVAGVAFDAASMARVLASANVLNRGGVTRREGFEGAIGDFRFGQDGAASRDLAILAIQNGRSGVVEQVLAV